MEVDEVFTFQNRGGIKKRYRGKSKKKEKTAFKKFSTWMGAEGRKGEKRKARKVGSIGVRMKEAHSIEKERAKGTTVRKKKGRN